MIIENINMHVTQNDKTMKHRRLLKKRGGKR